MDMEALHEQHHHSLKEGEDHHEHEEEEDHLSVQGISLDLSGYESSRGTLIQDFGRKRKRQEEEEQLHTQAHGSAAEEEEHHRFVASFGQPDDLSEESREATRVEGGEAGVEDQSLLDYPHHHSLVHHLEQHHHDDQRQGEQEHVHAHEHEHEHEHGTEEVDIDVEAAQQHALLATQPPTKRSRQESQPQHHTQDRNEGEEDAGHGALVLAGDGQSEAEDQDLLHQGAPHEADSSDHQSQAQHHHTMLDPTGVGWDTTQANALLSSLAVAHAHAQAAHIHHLALQQQQQQQQHHHQHANLENGDAGHIYASMTGGVEDSALTIENAREDVHQQQTEMPDESEEDGLAAALVGVVEHEQEGDRKEKGGGTRWRNSKQHVKKGKFSQEEDMKLYKAIQDYCAKNDLGTDRTSIAAFLSQKSFRQFKGCWKEIASVLPDRSISACFDHCRRCFSRNDRNINTGAYTPEEVAQLKRLYAKYGRNWAKIGRKMGRNRGSVRDKIRSMSIEPTKLTKGPWTEAEDQRLTMLVQKAIMDANSGTATPTTEADALPALLPETDADAIAEAAASASSSSDGDSASSSPPPRKPKKRKAKPRKKDPSRPFVVPSGGEFWVRISQQMGTRNYNQCRSHWFKALDPSLNKQLWSPEDDFLLIQRVLVGGYKVMKDIVWSDVAEGTKWTGAQCYSRWRSLVAARNKALKMQHEVTGQLAAHVSPAAALMATHQANLAELAAMGIDVSSAVEAAAVVAAAVAASSAACTSSSALPLAPSIPSSATAISPSAPMLSTAAFSSAPISCFSSSPSSSSSSTTTLSSFSQQQQQQLQEANLNALRDPNSLRDILQSLETMLLKNMQPIPHQHLTNGTSSPTIASSLASNNNNNSTNNLATVNNGGVTATTTELMQSLTPSQITAVQLHLQGLAQQYAAATNSSAAAALHHHHQQQQELQQPQQPQFATLPLEPSALELQQQQLQFQQQQQQQLLHFGSPHHHHGLVSLEPHHMQHFPHSGATGVTTEHIVVDGTTAAVDQEHHHHHHQQQHQHHHLHASEEAASALHQPEDEHDDVVLTDHHHHQHHHHPTHIHHSHGQEEEPVVDEL
ncbi:Nuclear receptor subfamily 4 group A member 2 [Balamuthia mandrillaris]